MAYLDLGFDVFDGVRRLDLESDGLSSQGLDEYLFVDALLHAEQEVRLVCAGKVAPLP